MNKRYILSGLLLLALVLVESPGVIAATALDYPTQIQPILDQSCTSCHGGSNPSAGIDLSSYSSVMASPGVVVPGNAAGSLLYTEVNSGGMPLVGSKLSSTQIQLISDWINQGAKPTATTTTNDTTSPIITLNGPLVVDVIQGTTYVDQGATAIADVDGNVPVTTSGTVDTNTIGIYTITYSATDKAGNTATATRTVNVVASTSTTNDTTPPVITLNGPTIVNVTQGTKYVDQGATAVDDVDGQVQVTTTGKVDTNTIGTYTITYTATDKAGNTATATRTVNVQTAATGGTGHGNTGGKGHRHHGHHYGQYDHGQHHDYGDNGSSNGHSNEEDNT